MATQEKTFAVDPVHECAADASEAFKRLMAIVIDGRKRGMKFEVNFGTAAMTLTGTERVHIEHTRTF